MFKSSYFSRIRTNISTTHIRSDLSKDDLNEVNKYLDSYETELREVIINIQENKDKFKDREDDVYLAENVLFTAQR